MLREHLQSGAGFVGPGFGRRWVVGGGRCFDTLEFFNPQSLDGNVTTMPRMCVVSGDDLFVASHPSSLIRATAPSALASVRIPLLFGHCYRWFISRRCCSRGEKLSPQYKDENGIGDSARLGFGG